MSRLWLPLSWWDQKEAGDPSEATSECSKATLPAFTDLGTYAANKLYLQFRRSKDDFRRKGTRLVFESWLSDKKSVHRRNNLYPAYQALRHSRKKIKPTRRLTENQMMSARQQTAAATSGNSNSHSTIDRPMTRQLARQLSDNGKQHILTRCFQRGFKIFWGVTLIPLTTW